MLNLLVFFGMGCAFGATLTALINMGLNSDLEAELRFWRKETLANRDKLNRIADICDDYPTTALAREIEGEL